MVIDRQTKNIVFTPHQEWERGRGEKNRKEKKGKCMRFDVMRQ